MLRMLAALTPVLAVSIYYFGWRVLALLAACCAAGLGMELLTSRRRNQPASTAVFVTCWLLAMSLPPTTPYWIAVVAAVVAVLFGKEVYGGFGRNWCNPAIVGRAFVYVCFPQELTAGFTPAFRGWPGGLAQWSFDAIESLPDWLAGAGGAVADAVSAATPMLVRRQFGYETPLSELFLGNIGEVFRPEHQAGRILSAGSVGEVSALVIILAGVYLLATRTANWRLVLGTLVGAVATNALLVAFSAGWYVPGEEFSGLLWRGMIAHGTAAVPPIPFSLFSGAMLFGAVFMVTDPVSAPKKRLSQHAYAMFIGAMIIVMRWKAQFSGAVGFAILLGNMIGPLLDMGVEAWERRQKAQAETLQGSGA